MINEPRTAHVKDGQLLGKSSLGRLLDRLAPAPGQAASSLYLRPGETERFLSRAGSEDHGWRERLARLDRAIFKSDTGVAGLRSGDEALVILPPYPLGEDRLTATWDTAPLLSLLTVDYTVGVVLLRLGRYSVAVYQGEKLVSSKTDTRYVKGRHHAGGTSQRRFQRIREGQMHRIFVKTCEVARAQLAPYAQQLDYILLGGERFTVNGFLKVCPFLVQFEEITLDRLLNIRDPKHDTLEEVGRMLRESRVYPILW